ncbi:MAG: hypothetical protein A3D44_01675 [Candidatus Staskawiczbacteria bacterium RIFCSPHIGHO2_02_FULL_42_22]|uniref:Uncharacterized protein n=1 Tax=Candidatus Staskawiczbacteria bacterium RIFCSPHIGHO2_02_FULL_42_22 TaxID=1802207 RepID=A0A1G2I2S2_9BACT|nr:MAG: hypothetical protein A3D44_01675 [Candidatus Staskawiczbacteria bacterium RIFCSPHIGHO2_02_FULL_42_22]
MQNKILLQIVYFGRKFARIFRRAYGQAEKFYQIFISKSSIFVTKLILQEVFISDLPSHFDAL